MREVWEISCANGNFYFPGKRGGHRNRQARAQTIPCCAASRAMQQSYPQLIHSLSTGYPQDINNLFTSTSTSEVDIAKTIYKFNDLRVPKLSTIVIHRLIHSALQHMLRCVIIRCSTWNIIGVHHAKICLRSVKKCERVGKCRVCQYYPTRARIEKYTADPAPAYTHPLLRAQKSHATD